MPDPRVSFTARQKLRFAGMYYLMKYYNPRLSNFFSSKKSHLAQSFAEADSGSFCEICKGTFFNLLLQDLKFACNLYFNISI